MSLSGNELRDQVWKDYYHRRQHRICSRCGDYSKYGIEEIKRHTEIDLNYRYGTDFHTTEYKIKTTRILTEQSLDSTWGCLCSKCQDHIRGRKEYFLDSSLEDIELELHDMKANEQKRQLRQEDEIKKLRKDFNKERRENGSSSSGKPVKDYVQLNPNDGTTTATIKNNNRRPPTESV